MSNPKTAQKWPQGGAFNPPASYVSLTNGPIGFLGDTAPNFETFLGIEQGILDTEASVQLNLGAALSLANLVVICSGNTYTGATSITLRKNGVNTALSVSIPATTNGTFQDTTDTVTIISGDLINFRLVPGDALTNSCFFRACQMTITSTTQLLQWVGTGETFNVSGSQTLFGAIMGDAPADTLEVNTLYTFRYFAKLSLFHFGVKFNATTSATVARLRINQTNAKSSLSIVGGTTGLVRDTTDTDLLSDGDTINYMVVMGTGGANVWDYTLIGAVYTTIGGGLLYTIMAYTEGGTVIGSNSTQYGTFGDEVDGLTVESTAQWAVKGVALGAQNLFARVISNSINGSSTLRTRLNNANGNLSIVVPASTSGAFEDRTNAERYALNDLVSWQYVTRGSVGSITITITAMVLSN